MAQTAKNGPTQSELRKLVKLRIKLAIIIATKLETKQYIAPLDPLTANGRLVCCHKCITKPTSHLRNEFLLTKLPFFFLTHIAPQFTYLELIIYMSNLNKSLNWFGILYRDMILMD